FALAPLILLQRSLAVPALQAEARVDPKTGLFNARYFAAELAEELGRAARFDRPMSLIMADLDLLRDINNTYGHLAGDAVLQGIAEVFRLQLRHYDVPARFGGEEFSILLPETPPEQAMEIAERIRRAVAERDFEVETSDQPIHATISIGVAGFPKDGTDANELIHQADLAVYRAKLQGRNRVLGASYGSSKDIVGIAAIVLLVAAGQALAIDAEENSISVSAVGALAGAALFGPRVALPLAVAMAAVDWSARRPSLHNVLYNVGALSLASLASAAVFSTGFHGHIHELITAAAGLVAGGAYFAVNMSLLSVAIAVEGRESWWR